MKLIDGEVKVYMNVKKMWVVKTKSLQVKLCDGYEPIYAVLRNRATQKLQELFQMLKLAGVEVYSFHTDCVYVEYNDAFLKFEEANKELFNYGNFVESVGKLKKLPVEVLDFESKINWKQREHYKLSQMGRMADKKGA